MIWCDDCMGYHMDGKCIPIWEIREDDGVITAVRAIDEEDAAERYCKYNSDPSEYEIEIDVRRLGDDDWKAYKVTTQLEWTLEATEVTDE